MREKERMKENERKYLTECLCVGWVIVRLTSCTFFYILSGLSYWSDRKKKWPSHTPGMQY